MPDYGKISWLSTTTNAHNTAGNKMNTFLELCKNFISQATLIKSCEAIVKERVTIRDAQKKIIEKISQQSFLAAFTVWVKEVASVNDDTINAAITLLENECVGVTDKNGKVWTILDARGFDHRVVIDAIRCKHELSLQEKEKLVTTYIAFMHWLSTETQGFISKLEDPDWIKVAGKALQFPHFVAFANALKAKEQLVAKLLYYGGTPTLDEVLKIQMEDVNFEKKLIRFSSQLISYPLHVFADIHALVEKRARGQLFLGRQNVPLRASTIFRNFKEAALKVGLDTSFSPALLTSSR